VLKGSHPVKVRRNVVAKLQDMKMFNMHLSEQITIFILIYCDKSLRAVGKACCVCTLMLNGDPKITTKIVKGTMQMCL
jgi:hypothetical protein